VIFFFQAEDGIRDFHVTGVQTCALPISDGSLNFGILFATTTTSEGSFMLTTCLPFGSIGTVSVLDSESRILRPLPSTVVISASRSEERRVGKECRSRRAPDASSKEERQA